MQQSLTGRPDFGPDLGENRETLGNTLRARIAARLGSVTQSINYEYQSSKASRYSDFDDMKSNVAPSVARSLSLAVQKR